jgi:16S rRNA (cytidine1402-2'-O)-methyltransferase
MSEEQPEGEAQGGARPAAGQGVLYVVATPIGNLRDIGQRALEILGSVDLILAEDTRHSAKLLAHYGITTACRSFHEHNETRQVAQLAERIAAGEHMALISDAGTPLISDPGFRLVSALREQGLSIVPIPGPSALLCALSVAGLATDRFCFEGFLPARGGARRRRLQALAREARTLVFYESPRRLLATLRDLAEIFGASRRAVVARELTKIHESVLGGTLADACTWFEEHEEQCRGELVIVVGGSRLEESADDGVQLTREQLLRVLVEALPVKQAVSVAARLTGGGRNALYERAVAIAAKRDVSGGEEE